MIFIPHTSPIVTSRDRTFLEIARVLGRRSTYERVRIGGVIANKRLVVGLGFNEAKSHPMQARFNFKASRTAPRGNIHAEISAINNMSALLRPASLTCYVYREGLDGNPKIAKPCAACQLALKKAGISRVVYTITVE